MENEIMVNEEVMNEVAEVVEDTASNGWKIAAGIGIAAVVGVVAYKVGKKIYAKVKAAKEAKNEAIEVTCEDSSVEEIDS